MDKVELIFYLYWNRFKHPLIANLRQQVDVQFVDEQKHLATAQMLGESSPFSGDPDKTRFVPHAAIVNFLRDHLKDYGWDTLL